MRMSVVDKPAAAAATSTQTSASPKSYTESFGPLPPLDGFDPQAGSTPAVTKNNKGEVWIPQMARPRRNRKNEVVRAMTRENIVLPRNFIYPLFIHDEVSPTHLAIHPLIDLVSDLPSILETDLRTRHRLDARTKATQPGGDDERSGRIHAIRSQNLCPFPQGR